MNLYAVIDPATGDVVQEYPTATDEQMEQALAAAAKAHREWSRRSTVAERAALIRQVAKLHIERREELAKIIQREMGKPLDQSLGEVALAPASMSITPTMPRSSSPMSQSTYSRVKAVP
jgi:succinate-semialdehyde dehydrogenase/glutarate-semialdehyde dehydrogenase